MNNLKTRVAALERRNPHTSPLDGISDEDLHARIIELSAEIVGHPDTTEPDKAKVSADINMIVTDMTRWLHYRTRPDVVAAVAEQRLEDQWQYRTIRLLIAEGFWPAENIQLH